jgi:hypothetical protein
MKELGPLSWETVPSLLALGLLEQGQVEHAATLALVEGLEDNRLVRLAGGEPTWPDPTLSLRAALHDRAVSIPTQEAAAVLLARVVAGRMVRGLIEPLAGARAIALIAGQVESEFHELDPFKYIDSEAVDRPEDHELFASEALNAAQDLVVS